MILYYIRHGDPIYDPDSLTPLGHRQAEALAKRLSVYGLDKVYCSTSNRAYLTAKPTCEILKLEPERLDFANEGHVWRNLTLKDETGTHWLFQDPKTMELFNSKQIRDLGDRWFDHPAFNGYFFEREMERLYREIDGFIAKLGYQHIPYTGKYQVTRSNDERVALFAHQGFGLAFLSVLLDIPYPMLSTHFDMCHSGMTVIEFAEQNGCCVPKVLTFSSDSHIYREGLPTKYQNVLYI